MNSLAQRLQHYFPASYDRGHPVLVTLGILSAIVWVFTEIWYDGKGEQLPENLMVVTFLVSAWGHRRRLKSDLVMKLLLVAIVLPLALFCINAAIDYDTAERYFSGKDFLKLFLFLPLAWWIGGSYTGALRMLAIAFLGLLVAIALDPNLGSSLARIWSGQRVDFNIRNAQHGALFFGVTFIFALCYAIQLLRAETRSRLGVIMVLLAFATSSIGLLGTQTRAAVLGLVVCCLLALGQWLWHVISRSKERIPVARMLLVVAIVIGLMGWSIKESIYPRIVADKTSIAQIFAGDLDSLPYQGIGLRVHSWVASLRWISERPLTGWGRKARVDVIRLADNFPEDVKERFGHLHNGYLEIAVGFGFPGLIFLGVYWAVLLSRTRQSAEPVLYRFVFYSSVFFLVMNVFESFFVKTSGEFAVAVFMAAGYCRYLANSLSGCNPGEVVASEGNSNR